MTSRSQRSPISRITRDSSWFRNWDKRGSRFCSGESSSTVRCSGSKRAVIASRGSFLIWTIISRKIYLLLVITRRRRGEVFFNEVRFISRGSGFIFHSGMHDSISMRGNDGQGVMRRPYKCQFLSLTIKFDKD